jgi:hypothetical protein
LKFLAAGMLLIMVGCFQPSQRFLPVGEDDAVLTVDQTTGQTCVSYPKATTAASGTETETPYCVDLYNSK